MSATNGTAETRPRHRLGFVGVHIGAGQHSETRHYLSICSAACAAAVKVRGSNVFASDREGVISGPFYYVFKSRNT